MDTYVGDLKWQWEVTCYYNDTVKSPKVPGGIAIQTVHQDEVSKDVEVSVANKRSDIGSVVIRYLGE